MADLKEQEVRELNVNEGFQVTWDGNDLTACGLMLVSAVPSFAGGNNPGSRRHSGAWNAT